MTETAVPLAGVHDVDWASLEHGPGVPRLLTDLAGGDPAARTTALRDLCRLAPDGVDVRPWVVAALPALLGLVTDGERPERGRVLRLIGDLAGADRTWFLAGETLRAKRLLAAHPGLTGLLADDDPAVRDAAAYTLRAVSRLTPGLAEQQLWERYLEEPDPAVRETLVVSSVLAGAIGSGIVATRIWLAWVADSDADLRVRITALTELVALGDPPPFDGETARDTLLGAYREGLNRRPAPVDDLVAPLLAGSRTATRQWQPGYPQVVAAVRASYRNDVTAHLDLVERMLALDAPDAWADALPEARAMVHRLRGPYRELMLRTAELLRDRDPLIRTAALRLLHDSGEIARPAAGAVWAELERADRRIRPGDGQDGRIVWVTWAAEGRALSPAVRMLAELRDERVLPMLERLLDDAPDTGGLHRCLAGFGVRARAASRTLRRRLRALRPEQFDDPGEYDAHRAGLLAALTAVAPNEAGDHLADEPIDLVTLGLLARAGRAAGGRAPEIRAALTGTGPAVELAAARAIWQVAGDAEAAAEVYDRYFDDRRAATAHAVAAVDGLGELGIRVASRARRLLKRRARRADDAILVATAEALWRVAGNQDPVRTLGRVWESAPELRPRIARLWAASGNARYGARFARAELDTVVRHNVSSHGLAPGEVSADERLVALCRQLSAAAP